MIIPSVKQRRADDKKRSKLMRLDALDGGDRCHKWTMDQYPDLLWTMNQLEYALDRLVSRIEEVIAE